MTTKSELLHQLGRCFLGEQPFPPVADWKGHFRNGAFESAHRSVANNVRLRGADLLARQTIKQLEARAAKTQEQEEPAEYILIPPTYSFACRYCGASPEIKFDGTALEFLGNACPYPNGLPRVEFELNVPSGRIVVTDDLRRWFPINGKENDVDTLLGRNAEVQCYSEAGLAHGYVGNTCPGVYRNEQNENQYSIGSPPLDEDKMDTNNWGSYVTGIGTTLWWYSIADYDTLQRHFAYYTPGEDFSAFVRSVNRSVVTVKPGVYRFRHNNEANNDQYGATATLYTEFEWVRDPDPIRDCVAEMEV